MADNSQHPAFPKPNDEHARLWRYLDVEKFRWLMTHSRLFMPSAPHLGDPLEGTRPAGDDEWWNNRISEAETEEERRILEHNRDAMHKFTNSFRGHYYVSCWHMNDVESEKMWQCYTKKEDAVVISTTYNKLRECLPRYINLGLVKYIDYSREPLPSLNLLECVTHKETRYSFENEIRAVVLHPPPETVGSKHFLDHHFESETEDGFLVFAPLIDVASFVESTVLHPRASNALRDEVAKLCRERGLSDPIESQFNRRAGAAL